MALIAKNTNTTTTAAPAAPSGLKTQGDKARKRTLARQQQISETIANASGDLLTRTQEAVSAVEQLKSAMEQIASAAEENAGAAEESLSAINQIQTNTQTILNDSKSGADNLDTAQKALDLSINNIERSADRIAAASTVADEVAKKSKDLKSASENIGTSVAMIADAADQTNLLALNAAIEAARAKEHGKGFAVVADETRALAEISATNAGNTRDVVGNIQKSIEKVEENITEVQAIIQEAADSGRAIVLKGNDLKELTRTSVNNTMLTGEKLTVLLDEVDSMQKAAQAIASAAEEQSGAVNQATTAIEAQASALAQSEQAASQLSDLAEELKTSTDVAKDAEEIASVAEELTSAIESITKTIDEIVGSLNQIENAAELAQSDASKNGEIASNCTGYVEEARALLDDTKNNVDNLKTDLATNVEDLQKIVDLTDQSINKGNFTTTEMLSVEKDAKTISKTLVKISNVVSQTTTLAVSGNIEAARAGEFGKGFAVVSSDIRNLALDSGANIETITDTMDILDEEVTNIVRDWGNAVDEQDREKVTLVTTKDDLNSVVEDADEVSSLLVQLNELNGKNLTALEQARTGSEQITNAAGQAKSNAGESKGAADLIQTTVTRMTELVEELAVAADELQRG
ncbi:MAG: methyl-accepting chemotaxis protein [Campylobacterota bacterium]|nr:methyl-accepting chemotaxis protein [Campylobacterota bacterium]